MLVATLPKFFILKYGNTKAMLEKRKKKKQNTQEGSINIRK